ncbi:MAG: mannonate dehydratase [Caldilineaceae bacterium]
MAKALEHREIDLVCEMIRTAARAGIDSLRYNTCILPIDRTAPEAGRGGYYYTAFRLDQIPAAEQSALTDAGRVTAEMHWERIAYLLERMIPVAEEYKVRMGNSQEDPATPPGYQALTKSSMTLRG